MSRRCDALEMPRARDSQLHAGTKGRRGMQSCMLKYVSTHVSPFPSLNRSSRQQGADAGPPLMSHTPHALRAEAAASAEAQVVPQMWMIPATISASCAFMMPVATAPNAIATEAGAVSPADMALCGLVLNPVLALVVTALCLGLVPILF